MTGLLAVVWPIVLMFPLVMASVMSSATATIIREKDVPTDTYNINDVASLRNAPVAEKDISEMVGDTKEAFDEFPSMTGSSSLA